MNLATKLTPLCQIAFKYGTDKCPQIGHNYTPFYYQLLKDRRRTIKKVLEIGVGSSKTMQRVPSHYQEGASLLMWREFLPNASIFGIDIDPRTIFQAERITTFLLDTRDSDNLTKLINHIGTDIDLVVDDGDHNEINQIQAAQTIMPLLRGDCVYIIEDVLNVYGVRDKLSKAYDCQAIEFDREQGADNIVIVQKRKAILR